MRERCLCVWEQVGYCLFRRVQPDERRVAYKRLMDTNTLLIIVLVVLLLGGGGFFYRGRR